jgi:uncharacterized sulfatase
LNTKNQPQQQGVQQNNGVPQNVQPISPQAQANWYVNQQPNQYIYNPNQPVAPARFGPQGLPAMQYAQQQAQYPNSLWNDYRYKMLAYQQWAAKNEAGELSPEQAAFFRPRPVEALFDLSEDPDETNNLALSPQHNSRLMEMRKELMDELKRINDLSFLTEAMMIREAIKNPAAFGRDNSAAIATYIDTANIATLPTAQAIGSLLAAVNSGDPLVRYWSLVAASSMTAADAKSRRAIAEDDSIIKLAQRRKLDAQPLVAARAAELLAILKGEDPREVIYRCLAQASSQAEALQILNIAVYLQSNAQRQYDFDPEKMKLVFKVPGKSNVGLRLGYFQPQEQPAE